MKLLNQSITVCIPWLLYVLQIAEAENIKYMPLGHNTNQDCSAKDDTTETPVRA